MMASLVLGSIGCHSSDVIVHKAPPVSDTLLVELTTRLASFEDARAMDLSPSMRLYVADAGADVVRFFQISARSGYEPESASDSGQTENLDSFIVRSGVLGGSGTDPGLFQEPYSVDASTALFVNVADAGNGRIQRFSTDGALVEVLPVPEQSTMETSVNPGFRTDRPALDGPGTGARPTSVESTPSDDIIVLDSGSRQVLMTDVQRRTWILPGDAQRRPIDPVDIETLNSRILIADSAGNRVFVFDRLGSLVEIMEVGGESPLGAVVPISSGLAVLAGNDLVLLPERVLKSSPAAEQSEWFRTSIGVFGQRPFVVRIDTPESITDARFVAGHLFVLTKQSLFVVTGRTVAP